MNPNGLDLVLQREAARHAVFRPFLDLPKVLVEQLSLAEADTSKRTPAPTRANTRWLRTCKDISL